MYDDYDYDDRHRGRNRDSRWDDGRDRQDYRSRSPRSREYRHSWHGRSKSCFRNVMQCVCQILTCASNTEREGRGPAPSLLPPRDSPPPSVNSPGKPGSSSHNIRPRTSLHRYKVQLERTEREEEERLAAEQKYFQAGPRDVDRADDAGPRYSLEPPSDTVVLVGLGDDRPRDLVCCHLKSAIVCWTHA